MGGGGPEVMQVMQQIAASIGSYSAGQAASAPATAADILEGASKQFMVRPTPSFRLPLPSSQLTQLHQSGSAAGDAAAGLDFGGGDGVDDEELNGPMQVNCTAAAKQTKQMTFSLTASVLPGAAEHDGQQSSAVRACEGAVRQVSCVDACQCFRHCAGGSRAVQCVVGSIMCCWQHHLAAHADYVSPL